MEELNEKMEQLQAMLEANISKMNKIVSDESQKTLKEAEILNESAKRLNLSLDGFQTKFGLMDDVLRNFKPSIEVKQIKVDVKEPLTWILSATGAILISFLVCFLFYNHAKEAKQERDYYKNLSLVFQDNFYKYKYLEQFGGRELSGYLVRFDDDFQDNRKAWIDKVIERDNQLEEAARAARESDLKNQEAKQAQRTLDSIKQKIR